MPQGGRRYLNCAHFPELEPALGGQFVELRDRPSNRRFVDPQLGVLIRGARFQILQKLYDEYSRSRELVSKRFEIIEDKIPGDVLHHHDGKNEIDTVWYFNLVAIGQHWSEVLDAL